MNLNYHDERKRFEWRGEFSERDYAKSCGFRWDPALKCWWTSEDKKAVALAQKGAPRLEVTARCREALDAHLALVNRNLERSRAAASDFVAPAPEGLDYLPYQKAGIEYASEHPNTLIGDEMGLGKTIQALGVINSAPRYRRILVVCPASLKLNWKREAERWLVRPFGFVVANTKTSGAVISASASADRGLFVIVNYDILHNFYDALRAREWDLVVLDEVHYAKNPKSRRALNVWGGKRKGGPDLAPIPAVQRIALTGTPILNRPIELWSLAHSFAPSTFPSWFAYAQKYCGLKRTRFGLDTSGASNLDDLQRELRSTFLVRRLKRDVLKELPAKRRQVIELPSNGALGAIEAERKALAASEEHLVELRAIAELAKASDDPEDYKAAIAALSKGYSAAFAEIAKLRHNTALAKVPYVTAQVLDAIESSGKVILFGHHKDVLAAIVDAVREAGHSAVVVTGDVKIEERQAAVDAFQRDPDVKLFAGTIGAAGVGLTLTESAHVIFAELDWVPANVTQAEDRAHRIGQSQSVLVQHLVLEDSLDCRIARTLVAKQAVIDAALDDAVELPEIPILPIAEPASASASRKVIEREAAGSPGFPAHRIAAIHAGLRHLAAVCDGAKADDSHGFSAVDVVIGHSLARAASLTPKQAALGLRLVVKYQRQLGHELVAIAKGES